MTNKHGHAVSELIEAAEQAVFYLYKGKAASLVPRFVLEDIAAAIRRVEEQSADDREALEAAARKHREAKP